MPPTGGMGGNTGIQDVYNLAWKLAYVLDGRASHSLLESYNTERQPVDGFLVQQAFSRFQTRVRRMKPDQPELADIICEIGYRYPKGAIVPGSDSGNLAGLWEDPYSPSVSAGFRLPHVELVDHSTPGGTLSTLDLIRQNLVLITADASSPWTEAAKNLRLKVDTYELSESSTPLADPHGKVKQLYKLDEGEALLVRPDGYIVWRAGREANRHSTRLKEILETILKPEEE